MNRRSVTMLTAALILSGGGSYLAYTNSGQTKAAAQITKPPIEKVFPFNSIRLEILIDGGFAYIPEEPNTLNIAYLNSWKYTGADDANPTTTASTVFCDVPQMGTDLAVLDGDVVSPDPTERTFEVSFRGISFPALQNSNAPLNANRPRRTASPHKPADPGNPADWEDLRFVPSLKSEHGARLNPDWPYMVNGLMVLRGGTLTGQRPGNYMANDTFEFKRNSVIARLWTSMAMLNRKFEQSVTDRTLYTVDIPAEQVEIELYDLDDFDFGGSERVVVKPHGASRTVRLQLTGRHEARGMFSQGQQLKEHCTFYQLLDPVPQPASWFRVYYKPQPSTTPQAMPMSPGYFCPGDWF